jgi:hypothetical protein
VSLENVTIRGGKYGKSKGEARRQTVCLSMYSITENIYCSQLSSASILLQPGRNCFTSYNTRKVLGSFSLCAIVLRSSPPSNVSTCNGQRSSQLFCVHYTLYSGSRRDQRCKWEAAWTVQYHIAIAYVTMWRLFRIFASGSSRPLGKCTPLHCGT